MAARPATADELNASFDRIEAGNQRARTARTRAPAGRAPSTTTTARRAVPARAPRTQPTAGKSDTPDSTGGGSAGGRASTPPATRPPATTSPVRYPAALDTGAGIVLVVLAWGWLGLPLLTGGPTKVKQLMRAKFLNQGPDGAWLP